MATGQSCGKRGSLKANGAVDVVWNRDTVRPGDSGLNYNSVTHSFHLRNHRPQQFRSILPLSLFLLLLIDNTGPVDGGVSTLITV